MYPPSTSPSVLVSGVCWAGILWVVPGDRSLGLGFQVGSVLCCVDLTSKLVSVQTTVYVDRVGLLRAGLKVSIQD